MSRLVRLVCLVWLAMLPHLLLSAGRAQAIELKCIEASKYKYLWKLFDNDPKKFAAYLQIDPTKLPNPEFCRAAVLSGDIDFKGETEKLINFILANRGWLATLYLSSGGGSIGEGVKLALVARMFWLKTRARFPLPLIYEPDFLSPPLGGWGPRAAAPSVDTSANARIVTASWINYQTAIKPLPQAIEGRGTTTCASSCSMIFAAGIDRQGIVHLHRPRNGNAFAKDGLNPNVSLSDTMQSLQGSERFQVALFEQMDAGEVFIRTYRTQPTNFTVPATAARTPPYVSDLMLTGCGSDAAQLQDIDTQLRNTISSVNDKAEGFVDAERLRMALRTTYERRELVETCVAALHERERLVRYAKVCGGNCNQQQILAQANLQFKDVATKANPPKPVQPATSSGNPAAQAPRRR